jgi:hypothetical protein
MFMHACVNMTLKRINASLEKQIHGRICHMKENSETDIDVSV